MDMAALNSRVESELAFLNSPEAATQIAARVAAQYAPAVLAAPNPDAQERAWEALRFYLTARPTPRKPFALTEAEAEQALAALRPLVSG